MPEVLFNVQMPDGETRECYSPSTVVRDYFQAGDEMTVAEFLERSRRAFTAASDRVVVRYGFACSSASAQLADIERWSQRYASDGAVRILSI